MAQLEDCFLGGIPVPALCLQLHLTEKVVKPLQTRGSPRVAFCSSQLACWMASLVEAAGLCSKHLASGAEKAFTKQVNQMQVLI